MGIYYNINHCRADRRPANYTNKKKHYTYTHTHTHTHYKLLVLVFLIRIIDNNMNSVCIGLLSVAMSPRDFEGIIFILLEKWGQMTSTNAM